MRGGAAVREALTGSADGTLKPDVERFASRLALGASFEQAAEAWVHERNLPGMESVVGALAVADAVGGPAADALDGLAASLRDRLALADETRALTAQSRASAWVVGLAPVGYLGFAGAVDRRSAGLLVDRPLGRVCLVAGLTLELAGVWWMRRLLAEEA